MVAGVAEEDPTVSPVLAVRAATGGSLPVVLAEEAVVQAAVLEP